MKPEIEQKLWRLAEQANQGNEADAARAVQAAYALGSDTALKSIAQAAEFMMTNIDTKEPADNEN